MSKYRCRFEFEGKGKWTPWGGSRTDFEFGFWLNKNHKFTKADDCKFWIPPARIYYIVAVEE